MRHVCFICEKEVNKIFRTIINQKSEKLCVNCNYTHGKKIQSQKRAGMKVPVKKRECLRCEKEFTSINEMRVCGQCKAHPDWTNL